MPLSALQISMYIRFERAQLQNASVVCCCKLKNTRGCDEHLFGQVINSPYSYAQMWTCEDMLAHNFGAPYIDM